MNHELFTRHPDNPILTRDDLPYRANTVFNAGAAMVAGETLLLLRVEDLRGHSHLTVARSADGVSGWRLDGAPTLLPSPDHPEEQWGVEDPRITALEEGDHGQPRYAVTYTGYSPVGPLVCLALTRDFRSFERLGAVLPPENKDAALFPVKLGGRWAMIHRPVPGMASAAHAWIAYSPDLRHWGDHRVLLEARSGPWWDAGKVGLSAPPLRTEEGWLLLYHGVKNTAAGCIYRLGLALLDPEDPARVIRRGDSWIFGPLEAYELNGDVGNVVFPCGWIADGDALRVYYGGADTCMALATARVSDLLEWLKGQGEG